MNWFWLICLSAIGWPLFPSGVDAREANGSVSELKLISGYPIDSDIPIEPSGLCVRDGRLFSVSDDTDDIIFEIVLEGASARFNPHIKFDPPESDENLDLEGISNDGKGGFYLLSENQVRVIHVSAEGKARWASPSGIEEGRKKGLFSLKGGQAEGLVYLDNREFLLAAERQPRGWMRMNESSVLGAGKVVATRFSSQLPLLRMPDFTGLDEYDGTVYVLFRNADLVTTLERKGNEMVEGNRAWSFRATVTDSRFAYQDSQFGMGEGIAVDAQHIYIVLDNNAIARKVSISDKRPALLIFQRPGD